MLRVWGLGYTKSQSLNFKWTSWQESKLSSAPQIWAFSQKGFRIGGTWFSVLFLDRKNSKSCVYLERDKIREPFVSLAKKENGNSGEKVVLKEEFHLFIKSFFYQGTKIHNTIYIWLIFDIHSIAEISQSSFNACLRP